MHDNCSNGGSAFIYILITCVIILVVAAVADKFHAEAPQQQPSAPSMTGPISINVGESFRFARLAPAFIALAVIELAVGFTLTSTIKPHRNAYRTPQKSTAGDSRRGLSASLGHTLVVYTNGTVRAAGLNGNGRATNRSFYELFPCRRAAPLRCGSDVVPAPDVAHSLV